MQNRCSLPRTVALLLTFVFSACGETPVIGVDAGPHDASPPDGGLLDAAREDAAPAYDAGRDAGFVLDDGGGNDAAADAGPPDAGLDDGGTDVIDSGAIDAGAPDGGVRSRVPIDVGVSGNGSCLLTDSSEMWCWGNGTTTPTYVADVLAIEGTCGLGVDRRIVCWNPVLGGAAYDNGPGTPAFGSDVEILGRQVFLSRADGGVHRFQAPEPTWAAPGGIIGMPAQNCALFADGSLTCWDIVRVSASPERFEFQNFWNAVEGWQTYDAVDVARRGTFNSDDVVICFAWTGTMPGPSSGTAGPNIYCATERGTTGSPLFARGSEIEIAGGRACAMTPAAPAGQPVHRPGVYCTADRPALLDQPGHWPLNPLPASDPYFNEYTDVVGTHLALGLNHACVMQGSSIMCWGDNGGGQLGDGTTRSSRTPVPIAW